MANNAQRNPLESYIRNIVNSVLTEKFGNQESDSQEFVDFSQNVGKGIRSSRRRRKFSKGRVKNPTKDRRLKSNRQQPQET
jgi:hypothetical protein